MATINTINSNILTTGALNILASSSVVLAASSSNTLKVDGASLVYLSSSKVGISNTNPLYSLDVSGSINTNASIFAANTISASAMSASNFYGTSSWSSQALSASYLTSVTNPYTITSSWAQSASNALFSQTSSYLTGGNVIASNISSSGTLFVQGNTTLAGNLTVLGTSSVINITSSVIIGGNKVVVNAYSPFQRYAGLSAYDSGSANNYSSSIYWDSLNNAWIIQGTGELTDAGITSSAVLIGGPISTFGSEGVLTVNTIPKAQAGGVNLANSLLTDNGTTLAYTGAGGISSSIITASIHYGSAFSSSVTNAIGFYGTSSWATTSSYASGSGVFAISSSYALNSTNSTSASYVSGNVITSNLNSTGVASFTNITSSGTISASSITASNLYVANAIVATSFTGSFSGSIGNAVNAQTASYLNGYANIPVSLAMGSVSAYQFNLSGSATTGSNTFGNINVAVSTGSAYGLVINATSGVSGSAYAISASNGIIIGTTISASNLFVSGNETDLGTITAGTVSGNTLTSSNDIYIGGNLRNGQGGNPNNSNFVGISAGVGATSANYSNFFGKKAGNGATNASNSNFNGYQAGISATNASFSNFLGNYAGSGATNASNSNFFGYQTGISATSANNSNFLGANAGNSATSASNSNFLGTSAGLSAASASNSNFLGANAGNGATNAHDSNFFGSGSGTGAVNAYNSNFMGQRAGANAIYAFNNNFFGFQAGFNATSGSNSNFIGRNAGNAASFVNYGNFIGRSAGQSAASASNSNFIGYNAGFQATNASGSNFIGHQAGYQATNASNGVFLGYQAGYQASTASNSIFIGSNTGLGSTSAGQAIVIGSGSNSNNTNAIVIGNGITSSANNSINLANSIYAINTNTTSNVGIGVATPVNTLQVQGNISASSYTSSLNSGVGFYGTSSWAVTASYAIGSLAGGTNNYVPLWTSTTTLSTSSIYQSASSVAINNTTFNSTAPESLLVSGSTFNVISGYGNLNSYIQLNIKNSNSGATGSSDIVATNDTGNETGNYVDLGINSSGHVPQGDVGQANDGYLYNTGSNFYIGNITPNKNLYFFAGSPTNTSSMVLTSTSNFGIGITSPVNKLDVGGNISASAITASTFTGTVYSSSTTNAVGYFGTSSYANNATSASYAVTASYSIASANAFLQGGNSFAQSASFGTNDNNILVVKTNNTTRLVVDTNSNLTSSVNIIPSADNTYNLGSSAFRFTGIYAAQSTIGALFETGLTTVGISSLSTGTVLTWRNGKLIPCDIASDEMVMGVVQNGKDEPIVFGAEPVLVTGVVNEGDYIVTSDKSGHGKGIPRGSVHPIDLFAKVIAQAVESGSGDSYTIKAMIRKM